MAMEKRTRYDGRIELDREDGYYKSGETAVCRVTLRKNRKALKGVRARMTLKWERITVETRDFETTGKPVEFSYTGKKPGWVYFGFELLGEDGKPLKASGSRFKALRNRKPTIVVEIGAMFSPDKIVSPLR